MSTYTDFTLIKENVLDWLESLRLKDANYGIYNFCENGNPTIMSSCFAVFIRELLNDLDSLSDKEKKEWIQHIKKSQNSETGLFIDPLFEKSDLAGKHDKEYIMYQNTMFCLSALNVLDAEPDYNLKVLDFYSDTKRTLKWLDELDWSKPWLISNNVMYLMYFFLDDYKRNNTEKSRQLLNVIFDYLDESQDENTGFWGTDKGANIFNGMAGAFHFYFSYFYMNREIKCVDRIIDHTLALQNKDGLFTPMGGGGHCDDLDAIDILVKFSMITDHRSNDVQNSLIKAFGKIIENQNSDGGFCYAKIPRYSLSDWTYCLKLLKPIDNLNFKTRYWMLTRKIGSQLLYNKVRNWTWKYSSWKLMSCQINQSDLWSSYFRLLALALISSHYPEEFTNVPEWKFREYGMGWHSPTIEIENNNRGHL